jgi:hypothetical protein
MKKISLFAGAAAAAMLAAPLAAQGINSASCNSSSYISKAFVNCDVDVKLNAKVPYLLSLSVENYSTDLGSPDRHDFDKGHRDASKPLNVEVKANTPWQVTIASPKGFGKNGSYQKATGDLRWSLDKNAYTSVTGSPVKLTDGNPTASKTSPVYLRTNWDYAKDLPGTYSISLEFTASAK